MEPMKKSRTFPRKPIVARSRIVLNTGLIAAAVLTSTGLLSTARPQSKSAEKPSDPHELVQEMVRTELEAQKKDTSLWQYKQIRERNGKRETVEVLETKDGTLDRLIAVNGRPLSDADQKKEDARLKKLASHPSQLAKKKKNDIEDEQHEQRLLQMLPDAFRYETAGAESDLVHLKFTPNPSFTPSTREAAVFHHLAGDLWIDSRSKRLARINGTLLSAVKFGGGMLGHLNKGGTFAARQQVVGDGLWELTSLSVQMDGKALFFHSIAIRQKQDSSDYHRVTANISPEQAAASLIRGDRNATTASSSSNGR